MGRVGVNGICDKALRKFQGKGVVKTCPLSNGKKIKFLLSSYRNLKFIDITNSVFLQNTVTSFHYKSYSKKLYGVHKCEQNNFRFNAQFILTKNVTLWLGGRQN